MTLVEDNGILWLAIVKTGSPPAWQPDTNYKLGDVVVPISPQVGQENLAFQCVGFMGKSNSLQPVFPTNVGDTIVDGSVEWKCVNPDADPEKLPYNQYFLVEQTVTIN